MNKNMKYILSLNFLGGENYYVRINDNSWDEVYSPEVATEFSTKKQAIQWFGENTTMAEYASAISKEDAIQKWKEFQKNGYIRRTFPFLNKAISCQYDKKKHSKLDVLKQRFDMCGDDNVRYEDYKTWPKLYEHFECLFDVRSYYTDENEEGVARTLEICVNKKTTFATFVEELRIALNFCEKEENEYKVFDIFDHFLSEYGNSACFFYKSDDDCRLECRYGESVEGNLKSVFDFWQKERYYE